MPNPKKPSERREEIIKAIAKEMFDEVVTQEHYEHCKAKLNSEPIELILTILDEHHTELAALRKEVEELKKQRLCSQAGCTEPADDYCTRHGLTP